MNIVQITDTHLSLDTPQRTRDLTRCVNSINALTPAPELVIHTGDITHHAAAEEYRAARTELDKLTMPYFVMAGNKDKRATLLSEFADARYQLQPQGWVQYSIEQLPVRLIMLDTVSAHSNKGELCDDRLNHLNTMLSADVKKPVYLFLHHTPFEAVGVPDPYQYEDWSDIAKLAKVLEHYTHIKAMYCGHVHRFANGSIANIDASAITCLAGDLRKGDVSDEQRMQPVYKVIQLLG